MNGQPTAQNTRETGCNGDLPGFRNWQNEAHVAELAELWNVEPLQIPHWGPPTHAMEIFRYAEQGSIEFLWVSGTNPAVSLPELDRIRSILSQDEPLPRRLRRVPDRDGPARRRCSSRGALGREDGHVHEHRPHRAPLRAGGRAARRGARRTWRSSSTTHAGSTLRDKDGQPLVKWSTPGGVLRGVEGVHARTAVRLHRAELRQAARRQRYPVALQRRGARRHGAALRGPRRSRRSRRSARTTDTISSDGRHVHRKRTSRR